jgi:hypothetical protein
VLVSSRRRYLLPGRLHDYLPSVITRAAPAKIHCWKILGWKTPEEASNKCATTGLFVPSNEELIGLSTTSSSQ